MTTTQKMIGATVVYEDEHGPYRFVRHGDEVTCICDPVHNLICRYHGAALALYDAALVLRAEPAGMPLDGPQVHQEVP